MCWIVSSSWSQRGQWSGWSSPRRANLSVVQHWFSDANQIKNLHLGGALSDSHDRSVTFHENIQSQWGAFTRFVGRIRAPDTTLRGLQCQALKQGYTLENMACQLNQALRRAESCDTHAPKLVMLQFLHLLQKLKHSSCIAAIPVIQKDRIKPCFHHRY